MWTYHGRTIQSYDLTKEIQALVTELKETKNRDEVRVMTFNFYNHNLLHFVTHNTNHAFPLQFIVVRLQNGLDGNRIGTTGIDYLVNLFGTLLIEKKYDYLNRIDLRVAIEADQRVYLVTNEEADDTKHFF